MAAGGVVIVPDDLVRIIDVDCVGGAGASGRIGVGAEGIDWHDMGSSLIVSIADSLGREAERDQTLSPVRFLRMSWPQSKCIVSIAGLVRSRRTSLKRAHSCPVCPFCPFGSVSIIPAPRN